MNPAAAWMLLAAAALVAELSTTAFVAVYVALGAAAAGLAAAAGAPPPAQAAVFAGVTLVLLLATRRMALGWFHQPVVRREAGLNDVVGRRGVVVADITATGGGLVRIGSELWTAQPYASARGIPAGVTVEVLLVEGITVLVWPVDDREEARHAGMGS